MNFVQEQFKITFAVKFHKFTCYYHPNITPQQSQIQLQSNFEHSRQIAGKKPPLTRLMHIGIETEKGEIN